MAAIAFALSFLAFFFVDIIGKSLPAFEQAYIQVPISYNASVKDNYNKAITRNYRYLVSRSYLRTLPQKLTEHPELLGTTEQTWVLASYRVDQYIKGHEGHGLKKKYRAHVEEMWENKTIEMRFNSLFFNHGDSKMAEAAGVLA
ncbi:MAG: DUF3333 domain-containing protein, partial [Mariprofundaceae bacterium]